MKELSNDNFLICLKSSYKTFSVGTQSNGRSEVIPTSIHVSSHTRANGKNHPFIITEYCRLVNIGKK